MALKTQLLFYLTFLTLVTHSFAQNSADGILFDAEDAVIKGYDKKNQVIILKNKVQIVHDGQYVNCDEATIDTQRGLITCQGNVRLISPDTKLQADRVELNYKNNTGEIFNGFVQVGQVLFEGETIKKLSETKYQTTRGRYTACTTCPPFWSFKGSKVDAEIGGYAYIKNAIIYFGAVPSFWFPYLVVPLQSERQTGLLFPSYHYNGSSGFTMQDSFFWAMSDSQDSTWTAKYYTKRGTKGLVNYRYVLSEDTKGELKFGYIKDRLFSTDSEVLPYNPSREKLSRWFLKYDHQYYLPYGFIHRMDINSVSDRLYPKDFAKENEIEGNGYSALENRISLTKNTDYSNWYLDTSYYRSLLNSNPIESNYASVHRFPEMNYSIMPTRIYDSNFLFSANMNYVNFARDNFGFDDNPIITNSAGVYDQGVDIIRTGQRLDLEPTISSPFLIGKAIRVLPSVSYRETRYQFSLGDEKSAYRHYARTNLSIGTDFSRIFSGSDSNPIADKYKHVIQPEIAYTATPWIEESDDTFFSSTDYKKDQPINNSDPLQFDYNDRIYEKNLATYSITNKILRKKWSGGTPHYQQILKHKLSQSYDIHENNKVNVGDTNPWSEITSLLSLRFDYFETISKIKYYPYVNDTTHNTAIKFYNAREDYLKFTYSQDFLITNGSDVDLTSKTRDIKGELGFKVKYVNLAGVTTYNLIKNLFQSYGYEIELKPPGNCWAIIMRQTRETDSEAKFDLDIKFLFDGKTEVGI